jgi:hypothetical protein
MIAATPTAKLTSTVAPVRLASARKRPALVSQTKSATGFLVVLLKALSALGA